MNRTYVFFGLFAACGLTMIACSDDETTTTTTSNTTVTTTGAGGNGGTSTTTTTGNGGMGGTPSTGGNTGTGGANSAAFCADYQTACDFGMTGRFADATACADYYDGASAACRTCLETHLGYAVDMPNDAAIHCPHACGESPCDADCGASGCM